MSSPARTRSPFRPTPRTGSVGPRASLPSMTTNKENGRSTSSAAISQQQSTTTATTTNSTSAPQARMKKRAHSLGGEALEQATKRAKEWDVLSPGKQARRRAAPRRSILRAVPAIFDPVPSESSLYSFQASSNHTTDLSSLSTFAQRPVAAPPVPAAARRRSSIRAAPGAFNDGDDSDEDEEDEDDDDANGSMDMDLTRMEGHTTTYLDERRKSLARRVSFAPNAHIRTFTPDKPTQAAQQANALAQAQAQAAGQAAADDLQGSDEEVDYSDEESEPSMEMAGDEVTLAFAGHFAGTVLPVSAVLPQVEQGEEEEDEEAQDEDEESEGETMEMANTQEITSAFGLELGNARSVGGVKPRPSEVRRQEDADDEAVMKELGIDKAKSSGIPVKKGKSRASIMFAGVPSSDGDDQDDTVEMQDDEADTEELDRTMPMDQTTAIGRVLAVAGELQDQVEKDESEEEDDETSIAMDLTGRTDITTTNLMEVTTSYGGIISGPSPSTPLARQRAQMFARQVASGLMAAEPSPIPNSPRRVTYPGHQYRLSLGPRSPGRSLVSAPPSVSKSPRSASVPLFVPKSPRSLVGAAVPKSPARTPVKATITPASVQTTPIRKSMSPVKKAATPRSAAPAPAPARRMLGSTSHIVGLPSPGRSLSLRGMLHEQQLSRATQSPYKSPARVNWAVSPVSNGRVTALQQTVEDDSTGSSFDYINDDVAPPAKLTLNEFFKATGTAIMKDVIAMTGVDLTNRRKSVAPSSFGRETSGGPPSFADLAVAGGCKSLFYQLYQNDHARLHEDIMGAINDLAEVEVELERNQPRVFEEWQQASEQHRSIMQVQFNMIKRHYHLAGRTDWNECRTTNYDSIIGVMEDNLEGLRADNAVIEETRIGSVIPELRARREALLAELHAERQRDLELSACDQDELKFAHESLNEQAEQIEHLELGYTQVASQLAGLIARSEELTQQVSRAMLERDSLHRSLEDGRCFTKAEVFRLQAEYEALQRLNGWTLLHFSGMEVRLAHLDEVVVTLRLGKGRVEKAELELVPNNKRQQGKDITRFLFNKIQSNVDWVLNSDEADAQCRRAKSLLQRIASLWTSVRHLRHELQLTHLRYPTTTSYDARHDVLRTAIEIHVASAKSTFYVVLELTGEELVSEDERRPVEMESVIAQVGSEVVVKFGRSVDTDSLKYIVRERLDQGGRGALLAACYEAESKYSA